MTNKEIENDDELNMLKKEFVIKVKEALSFAKTIEEAEEIKARLHTELDEAYSELKRKKSSSNSN